MESDSRHSLEPDGPQRSILTEMANIHSVALTI